MPLSCSVCNHPRLREITGDLMARRPYRSIQSRYGISKSALERHVSRHVTKALRKLTAVDMPIALAAEVAEPVLVEMRKLNARSLRILKSAEEEKDHAIALCAVRECRRNLELIAKLTGELDPRAPGEASNGALQVTVVYADKAIQVSSPEAPMGDVATRAMESSALHTVQRAELRKKLSTMSITAVMDAYRSAYFRCKLEGDKVPPARAIQTLVQAWKEMRGWSKRP